MMVLQGVLLVLLAVGGTTVVLVRDPLRQSIVAGVFGLLLGVLFFAFQAPDVALSQIVVGSLVLPAMIVLTLAKLAQLRGLDE
jgi:energy-converting hydrogenase B subunit D